MTTSMATPMSTVDRLRQVIAEIIQIDAQALQAAIGRLVVATSAEHPSSPDDARSVHDAAAGVTVLLADRIPAGQEAQVLAAEIERHHGRQAAQAVLGDQADELLGFDGNVGQAIQVHGQEFNIGPRELVGGLIDYAERFADSNGEPVDGDCRRLIRSGQAWFESGSATIDIDDVGARLAEYVTRFADSNGEPEGGNCRRLLERAAAMFGPVKISRFRQLAAAIGEAHQSLRRFEPQDHSKERCLAEIASRRSWYELAVHVRDTYPWKTGPEFDARAENVLAANKSLIRAISISEELHPGISSADIPAGQEVQVLAAEIERNHGRAAAQSAPKAVDSFEPTP